MSNYLCDTLVKYNSSYVLDKERNIKDYIMFMLNKTQSMFKYNNLPKTIPQRNLELYLQTSGVCVITKVDDELYCFIGGYGGEPNVYYEPTIFTVANPYLKFNKMLNIDEDCVIFRNDSLMKGLLPIHYKYAELLAENDITMRSAIINLRVLNMITATDDNSRNSAIEYLKQLEKGNIGVVAENALFEGIKLKPTTGAIVSNYLTQLTEINQYLKASWFNELGIQANFNMKREALNSAETGMNVGALLPLIDDMLNQRKIAVDKINEMYGTDITVEFNSTWANTQNEVELKIKMMESEVNDENEPINNESEQIINEDNQSEQVDDNETEQNNSDIEEAIKDIVEEVIEESGDNNDTENREEDDK